MPIKINLLAEEQAAEELRRKDPFKRAIMAAVAVVALVLLWAGYKQVVLMRMGTNLETIKADYASIEKAAKEADKNQKKVVDEEYRLDMLKKMAAARPLAAPLLDAVQKSLVDDIQVLHVRVQDSFQITPAFRPPKGSSLKPKPAIAKQNVSIIIEAKDLKYQHQNYTRFKEKLAETLKDQLGETGTVALKQLSAPREGEGGDTFVTFGLECVFPEVVR